MRRSVYLFILAALTTILAGCHSDNPTKRADQPVSSQSFAAAEAFVAPEQHAAIINDRRPIIVCFGDSLTAGYGAELGKSYPDYLQADLDAKGYHYRVVNKGISGNTTKDGVERVDTILALKPALVVVEFGGNDGLRGLRIEDSPLTWTRFSAPLRPAAQEWSWPESPSRPTTAPTTSSSSTRPIIRMQLPD